MRVLARSSHTRHTPFARTLSTHPPHTTCHTPTTCRLHGRPMPNTLNPSSSRFHFFFLPPPLLPSNLLVWWPVSIDLAFEKKLVSASLIMFHSSAKSSLSVPVECVFSKF